MLQHLQLRRPLAVIDVETTGTNPQFDRIVEISILKLMPDGRRAQKTRRLNPTVPIPSEATAVHGISDADVENELTFRQVAGNLFGYLENCDLCGFNAKRFDFKILDAEFHRVGLNFSLEGRVVIDPMEIFHKYEKRDLAAAVQFYLDESHDDAHSAEADVLATVAVLDAMVARYDDLPCDINELHAFLKDPSEVDSNGTFTRVGSEIRFKQGKHRGQPLYMVAEHSPDYLRWMLSENFPKDTKQLVEKALHGLPLN